MPPHVVEAVVSGRGIEATVRNTSNPTVLEAGYKHNVIPGTATALPFAAGLLLYLYPALVTVGAVALGRHRLDRATVVGLALGLLLPGTEREDELMGSTRDQLVDRAEETVERAKDAAVEAGREVKETVKSEFEQRKPELQEAVQEAGQHVKAQVKESARRVKEETKDAAKKSGNTPRSNS